MWRKWCPEWPNSDIYQRLNGNNGFISTLNENIKNKIEAQNWWYGDMHNDFVGTLSADEVYKVETGQMDTKYYGHSSSDKAEVTNQRWTKMEEKANIGLIYLHDYYYQAKQESCHNTKNSNYKDCINQGWMHMKNNGGGSLDYEWTITRSGRSSDIGIGFGAWLIRSYGNNAANSMEGSETIRPVFYLQSTIELGGAGSTSEPFYIKN